jgi:dephospho-CoA kinase
MIIIGLTGSIAMGKSEVARILVGEGLPLFDADKEVHALYDSTEGAELLQPLVPSAVKDGRVDRKKLSDHLVSSPDDLDPIEKVVHAEIARRRNLFLSEVKAQGHRFAVVDVPLLFEKGGDKDLDVTVVVSTPADQQRSRALARPGMTQARLEMILKRQMPDLEKRMRADYVIENSGTLQELHARTLTVLDAIKNRIKPNA